MKILVTGAGGQVGRSIIKRLGERQHEFLGLSHDQLDITDNTKVTNTLLDYNPRLIINAAAYTDVDLAESNPEEAYAVNCQGVANLASACTKLDVAIIHLSTDYVFSGDSKESYSEEAPTNPINIYGKTKLAGEQALSATPKHLILRTSWVFSESGNNFISSLLALGQTQTDIKVVNDQFGTPTYAGDLAAALITIADCFHKNEGNINWGIYHYAGYPGISRFELASYLFHRAQQSGLYHHPIPDLRPIASTNYPTPAKRPANTRLCCHKIQQEFGIMPSHWQAALDQLLNQSLAP